MSSLRERAGLPPAPKLRETVLITARELRRTATRAEIIQATAERLHLTEEQQSVSITDGRMSVVSDRVGLALSDLKAVGALDNPAHGLWTVTETGESIGFGDVEKRLTEVRAEQQRRRQASQQTDDDGEDQIDPAANDADWRDQLLQRVHELSPTGFERLTEELLVRAGFDGVKVTPASQDGGIDGFGTYRPSGLISFLVGFQCKRWKSAVGSPEVQQFRGALPDRCDRGIMVTTSHFTPSATKAANEGRRIDLIDGERLCELLKEYKIGVRTEMIEQVTVDEAYFDRFLN